MVLVRLVLGALFAYMLGGFVGGWLLEVGVPPLPTFLVCVALGVALGSVTWRWVWDE